ncbi:hypothetical protein KUCAC02_022456 [Chaenocephalus aceratus]|uniref:Uncharacterized protein n=1 Tax=Chaenocephalus aceratus TaxID=36190 RepID=A0ACB9XM50_CHAAC|nr:hypothetical protein KUCAC02_022456 [Chaenocephalus aceratus]
MSSNELSVDMDSCIRTFKEHMHLALEPPKIPGVGGGKRGATSPKTVPKKLPAPLPQADGQQEHQTETTLHCGPYLLDT